MQERTHENMAVYPFENIFNQFCELAKAEDIPGLNAALKASGKSIHLAKGFHTPMMQLAKEGHHRAVDFLYKYFYASLNDAIVGYALVSDIPHVEEMLSLGADANCAIFGFACAGNKALVHRFVLNCSVITREESEESIYSAVQGYAYGNHNDEIIALGNALGKNEGIFDEPRHRFSAVKFAAFGGHIELVNSLLIRWPVLWRASEYGYAWAGNKNEVDRSILAMPHVVSVSKEKRYSYALKGYARGGYVECVDDLLPHAGTDYYTKCFIMNGYALSGHTDKVDELKRFHFYGCPFVKSYFRKLDVVQVNHMTTGLVCLNETYHFPLLGKASERLSYSKSKRKMPNGREVTNDRTAIRIHALINNPCVRNYLAKHISAVILKSCPASVIIKKSKKINEIMQEYDLYFHQAESWLTPQLHIMFLQVMAYFKTFLPLGVIDYVASYAFSLPTRDMRDLYIKYMKKMPIKLLEVSDKAAHARFFQDAGFSAGKRAGLEIAKDARRLEAAEKDKAFERYVRRVS